MRIDAFSYKAYIAVFFGVSVLFFALLPTSLVKAQEDLEALGVNEELSEKDIAFALENASKEEATTRFSVTPVVANEKAKPRDIIKKELRVSNNTQQKVELYISVENIDPTEGAQDFVSPSVSDLSTSLANWIEITRGVIELSPGETRKIPYLIHVNLNAVPGSYFARIQFREGAKRNDTETAEDGTALMLNLEVLDDAKERLQLGNFVSDDSLVIGDSVGFSYLLENVGNRMIEPRGSIRVFNRRGEEVGSIPLNAEGTEINPSNKRQLAAVWNASGRFGKYKAFLDLEYGENQLASVQDTLYFWVFPWKEILGTLFGVLVLAIFGTYIVHMRSVARPTYAGAVYQPEETHEYPTAPATPPPVAQQQPRAPTQSYTPGSGPTVLAPRSNQTQEAYVAVEMPSARQNSTPTARVQQGATVELSSRGRSSAPVKEGNTVQLAPRR